MNGVVRRPRRRGMASIAGLWECVDTQWPYGPTRQSHAAETSTVSRWRRTHSAQRSILLIAGTAAPFSIHGFFPCQRSNTLPTGLNPSVTGTHFRDFFSIVHTLSTRWHRAHCWCRAAIASKQRAATFDDGMSSGGDTVSDVTRGGGSRSSKQN